MKKIFSFDAEMENVNVSLATLSMCEKHMLEVLPKISGNTLIIAYFEYEINQEMVLTSTEFEECSSTSIKSLMDKYYPNFHYKMDEYFNIERWFAKANLSR